MQAEISDVSILGMFVASPERVPGGSECEASFMAAPEKPVRVRCRVVRNTADGFGLEIVAIANDTFENLRTLIVEHAEDPSECDTQIRANIDAFPALY